LAALKGDAKSLPNSRDVILWKAVGENINFIHANQTKGGRHFSLDSSSGL